MKRAASASSSVAGSLSAMSADDGLALKERRSEIAPRDASEVSRELDGPGKIESQRVPELGDARRGRVLSEEHDRGVAGDEPQERGDDEGDAQESEDEENEAPRDVAKHRPSVREAPKHSSGIGPEPFEARGVKEVIALVGKDVVGNLVGEKGRDLVVHRRALLPVGRRSGAREERVDLRDCGSAPS